MSKTPESILKDEVVDFLKRARYLFFRMQSGKVKVRGGWMQLCPEGTGDILVFPIGWTVWLELKDPNGVTAKKRKEAQAAFAEEARALGHRYAICESLDDVRAALDGITIREV